MTYFNSLKNNLTGNVANIPGWTTKRKLIIIESDDWGSIRMPSVEVFENLQKSGIDLTSDEGARFNRYDSLANSDDLSTLFEVLSSFRDSTGRPPVITPVAVVANPDFPRIISSGFTEYFYEPFTETLKSYYGGTEAFSMWHEGMEQRLFIPQFHGREHLNVNNWMKALRAGHENTLIAFNNRMWGISTANDPLINLEFQAAFDFNDPKDLNYQSEIITSGLHLFKELLGYHATYFVPPNGPFSSSLEKICAEGGIKYLATSKIEAEPLGNREVRKRFHWLGQISGSRLIYMTRNCHFEPSSPGVDWVDSCLLDIKRAFRWNKPAVISSHRVNFIGSIHPENRDKGTGELKRLLNDILKNWPDAEFITSAELGELVENDKGIKKS